MIILGTTLVLTTGVMWLIMWGIPQLFGKLSSIKFRIPENWNIFYIILAILALGAIVWFFRSRGTGYAGTVATNVSRWLLWPMAIMLAVALIIGLHSLSQERKEAMALAAATERQALIDAGGYPCPFDFEYIVTREWGKTVTRPAGCHFAIERRVASVGYEMAATTTKGDVLVSIPAGEDPKKTTVVGNLLSFRLRIMEEETEDEMPVMVSLYRR